MKTYDHFEYGRMLADKLKPISGSADKKKYYECSESDNLLSLTNRLSSIKEFILIAVDGCNADFQYGNNDNLVEVPQYFFMVAHPAPNDNPDKILSVQKICKNICRQIQAKMMVDLYEDDHPLNALMPETFTLRGIGPLGDNLYGCILGFNLHASINFEIDNTMWL